MGTATHLGTTGTLRTQMENNNYSSGGQTGRKIVKGSARPKASPIGLRKIMDSTGKDNSSFRPNSN